MNELQINFVILPVDNYDKAWQWARHYDNGLAFEPWAFVRALHADDVYLGKDPQDSYRALTVNAQQLEYNVPFSDTYVEN